MVVSEWRKAAVINRTRRVQPTDFDIPAKVGRMRSGVRIIGRLPGLIGSVG